MTYTKTYLPTLKMHIVNLKCDAKDLSRDLQWLEVCGKLGSKTLYYFSCYSILPAAFPTLLELGTVRLYFCACSINQCFNLLLV